MQAASSVCSAFSYILAFAGSFVVWHGRSAFSEEQKAARTFVNELAEGARVTEERESGEQVGLFWQIVGVEEYSSSIVSRKGCLAMLSADTETDSCGEGSKAPYLIRKSIPLKHMPLPISALLHQYLNLRSH